MRIGIPKEVKVLEGRVGLIPAACAELHAQGHTVYVETQAGVLSGYSDEEYQAIGAQLMPDAASVYAAAEMIVKVKEPQPQEWAHLRADHRLFCYLHLAAEPDLMTALLDIGVTGIAFETVQAGDSLPLLAPMSNIAGRLSAQWGSQLLLRPAGGKGILLGGLAGSERGRCVVLGAGVAGHAAAADLAARGAEVLVFEKRADRREQMHQLGPNVSALYPFADALAQALSSADLLVGAVLIPGIRAPHVVSRDMIKTMKPGSVVVDISVDQGGCIETTRPTTYADPTYVEEEVVHFAVTNMPGAVPRTASQALSSALLPYASRCAQDDWAQDPALKLGLNVQAGKIIYPGLQN